MATSATTPSKAPTQNHCLPCTARPPELPRQQKALPQRSRPAATRGRGPRRISNRAHSTISPPSGRPPVRRRVRLPARVNTRRCRWDGSGPRTAGRPDPGDRRAAWDSWRRGASAQLSQPATRLLGHRPQQRGLRRAQPERAMASSQAPRSSRCAPSGNPSPDWRSNREVCDANAALADGYLPSGSCVSPPAEGPGTAIHQPPHLGSHSTSKVTFTIPNRSASITLKASAQRCASATDGSPASTTWADRAGTSEARLHRCR